MRRRRLLKLLAAAFCTLSLLTFSAEPALAHFVYSHGYVTAYPGYCQTGYSEASHGSYGNGYIRIYNGAAINCMFESNTHLGGGANWWQWYADPPGQGGGGTWVVCWNSGWIDGGFAKKLERKWTWASLCNGSGYYATMGHHYMEAYLTWYGGATWSGEHFLPA